MHYSPAKARNRSVVAHFSQCVARFGPFVRGERRSAAARALPHVARALVLAGSANAHADAIRRLPPFRPSADARVHEMRLPAPEHHEPDSSTAIRVIPKPRMASVSARQTPAIASGCAISMRVDARAHEKRLRPPGRHGSERSRSIARSRGFEARMASMSARQTPSFDLECAISARADARCHGKRQLPQRRRELTAAAASPAARRKHEREVNACVRLRCAISTRRCFHRCIGTTALRDVHS